MGARPRGVVVDVQVHIGKLTRVLDGGLQVGVRHVAGAENSSSYDALDGISELPVLVLEGTSSFIDFPLLLGTR